ncbi:MAG: hypothetical protein H0X29_01410 [Parachlamydiaceae bacterium]|nr:hypothetical protein [Parachlamydiaceae bacterium]
MRNFISHRLTTLQFNQFKFPHNANRITKGIMLLPLALSVVYVVHLTQQAIITNDCRGSSKSEIIECTRSVAKLWGVLGGFAGGLAVLHNTSRPPYSKGHPKEKIIFEISNVRRNIFVAKAQLEHEIRNNSAKSEEIILKIADLTYRDAKLQEDQKKLWEEIKTS